MPREEVPARDVPVPKPELHPHHPDLRRGGRLWRRVGRVHVRSRLSGTRVQVQVEWKVHHRSVQM